jgi:sialidase-1
MTHLGNGVVLASWDGRPGSAADAPNPNSIVQRRSTDGGRTWGPVQVIAAGHTGNATTPKYGYSDPSYIFDAETGKVFNFFVYSKDQGFFGSRRRHHLEPAAADHQHHQAGHQQDEPRSR